MWKSVWSLSSLNDRAWKGPLGIIWFNTQLSKVLQRNILVFRLKLKQIQVSPEIIWFSVFWKYGSCVIRYFQLFPSKWQHSGCQMSPFWAICNEHVFFHIIFFHEQIIIPVMFGQKSLTFCAFIAWLWDSGTCLAFCGVC